MNWYPAVLFPYRDKMLVCRDGIRAPLKCYNGQWAFRGYSGMGAVEVCAVLNNYDAAPVAVREPATYLEG